MAVSPAIVFVESSAINKERWDNCIETAANGLIYAKSYYLDALSPGWAALVQGNYERVFPLTARRKWGITYLYQPFFVAQLGLFGNDLSGPVVAAFLGAIPRQYRYWDIALNPGNFFPDTGFPVIPRRNFELNLQPSYPELAAGYRQQLKRNLRKAASIGCTLRTGFPVEEVAQLAAAYTPGIETVLPALPAFQQLYQRLYEKGEAITYGIAGPGGELLSSCVFLLSPGRAYYLLVGNHPNGRTLGASHLLLDAFIQDHAEQDLRLDFEGGDSNSLAFFYSSFGAETVLYPTLRVNRLPPLLRWIKG